MKAPDVLRALGELAQPDREAHHNIHAIWWLVRDLGSTGVSPDEVAFVQAKLGGPGAFPR